VIHYIILYSSEKDTDGSVRPTGGMRLCYKVAHSLCRSGKA
jgi:hypothetical protein